MGDNRATDPDSTAGTAGLRLRAALAERRRADAAIRAAVHDLLGTLGASTAGRDVPDSTMAQNVGAELSDTLAHAVPDLSPEDVALAAVTADRQLAAAPPSTSSSAMLEQPARPPMPPVVFLRGAGVNVGAFDRIHAALWARGLWTITDRTRAMHLSRGGLPVWMVDFSIPNQPATPPAPAVDAHEAGEPVSIARVRALYEDTPGGQQMTLKRISGHRVDRPMRVGELDVDALADQVAAVVLAPQS